MRTYKAFYKDKSMTVSADTSRQAQIKAATYWKAKKAFEVTVILADTPVSTASLGA